MRNSNEVEPKIKAKIVALYNCVWGSIVSVIEQSCTYQYSVLFDKQDRIYMQNGTYDLWCYVFKFDFIVEMAKRNKFSKSKHKKWITLEKSDDIIHFTIQISEKNKNENLCGQICAYSNKAISETIFISKIWKTRPGQIQNVCHLTWNSPLVNRWLSFVVEKWMKNAKWTTDPGLVISLECFMCKINWFSAHSCISCTQTHSFCFLHHLVFAFNPIRWKYNTRTNKHTHTHKLNFSRYMNFLCGVFLRLAKKDFVWKRPENLVCKISGSIAQICSTRKKKRRRLNRFFFTFLLRWTIFDFSPTRANGPPPLQLDFVFLPRWSMRTSS